MKLHLIKNFKEICRLKLDSKFLNEIFKKAISFCGSKKELAFIAHVAEVENGTGLGDVINQYYGGFLAKYAPSYKFEAVRLPIKNC